MTDTHTKEQRSKNMAAIRSRGNQTTEMILVKYFRKNRISGWRRHVKHLAGKPDFIFKKQRFIVFVDGCFWHGCRNCALNPKSNIKYWKPKIEGNIARDKRQNTELRKAGWTVLRLKEHEIKRNPEKAVKKVIHFLEKSESSSIFGVGWLTKEA